MLRSNFRISGSNLNLSSRRVTGGTIHTRTWEGTTHVTPVSVKDGVSMCTAVITSKYSVAGAPNGGYMAVLCINACKTIPNLVSTHPDPISMGVFYTNKAIEDTAAEITATVVNITKSSATISVTLAQQGELKCIFTFLFGTLSRMKGFSHSEYSAPKLPSPVDCKDISSIMRPLIGGKEVPLTNELDYLIPEPDPFVQSTVKRMIKNNGISAASDTRAGTVSAVQSGYVRIRGSSTAPDMGTLAFLCDCLPPPILNISPSFWVPTLSFTVTWLAPPSPTDTYLRFKFASPQSRNSLLLTDGELWSFDGTTLLAQSRQTARVLNMK